MALPRLIWDVNVAIMPTTWFRKRRLHSQPHIDLFDNHWNDTCKTNLQEVTDEVIENITAAYNENSPDFNYFVTLYNIFSELLEDVSENHLPNEATGFKESKIWSMLYNFQKDAVLAILANGKIQWLYHC